MTNKAQVAAWIGIGKMGLPITARMSVAGIAIAAFDRDPARMELANQQGVGIASSMADAVAGQRVIFTSLPDDAVLRAVLLSSDGLLSRIERGSILVETSTVSVEVSAEIDRAATAREISYLRVPVSGNAAIAHTGELTCFVSGPRNAFESIRHLLETFTRAQVYLGGSEEARFAKLAVNLMVAVSAGMMAESAALARKGGVAWGDILDVIGSSSVASPVIKSKAPQLAQRDFESTFSCRQMAKDLDLILSAGHRAGVSLQLAAQMREMYAALIAQGDGEADYYASIRYAEKLSGLGEPELTPRKQD